MTKELREILEGLHANVDAMEADGLTMDDYKEILKAKGANIEAMEADGIFNDTPNPNIPKPDDNTTVPPNKTEEPINFLSDNFSQQMPNPWEGKQDPMDNSPKPTVNPDGTISTLTTGQPEDKQGAFSDYVLHPLQEGAEQVVAGARRSVTLPLAKMLDDTINWLGIETDHIPAKDLEKVNKLIEEYEAKHKDQTIHPATIGSLVSQFFVPLAKSKKVVAATEGLLNALDGIGKRNDYEHVGRDAAVGTALGASSMWLVDKLTKRLGDLSYGTKLLIKKHPDLDEETVAKVLKGVPKEDQAYVLANYVDDADFVGFVDKAVAPSNADKLLLRKQAKDRSKGLKKLAIGDVDKQVAEAKEVYGKIADEIAADKHNVASVDDIATALDGLVKRYEGNTKAQTIVNNMKADIAAGNGVMDVRTALELRQDINYLLSRAKRYKEKESLNLLKGKVNKFLENNLDSNSFARLEQATQNYARAMNNKDFVELMDKYTKKSITDWVEFKKALKKEKLSSPEIDSAIDIVNEFSKKFKLDREIRSITKTKGQSDTAMTALGARSWLLQHIIGPLDAMFVGSTRHRELVIQKEILNGIRRAGDPKDIIKEILKSKKLKPEEAQQAVKAIRPLLEYKPDAPTSVTDEAGNVKTLFATEAGTVGENPSKIALHDAQRELVQKALGENKYSDNLIDKTAKLMQSKRFDSIIKSTRNKLKVDDANHNMKVVKNIITNEAKQLIRQIEKTEGVKLPQEEAEKIIKMKFKAAGIE